MEHLEETAELAQESAAKPESAPIQVQLFTRIHEGMRVALAVPSAPVMNVHDTVFKIQRIKPNGTVVLKKMKSLSERKPQ